MTEYMFRQVDFSTIELAKFTDHMEPDDIYTLRNGHCNCPAYKRPCKHLKWVELWKLLQEEGQLEVNVYQEDTNKWYTPWWYAPELVEELLK